MSNQTKRTMSRTSRVYFLALTAVIGTVAYFRAYHGTKGDPMAALLMLVAIVSFVVGAAMLARTYFVADKPAGQVKS
jgi:hypothetical protein